MVKKILIAVMLVGFVIFWSIYSNTQSNSACATNTQSDTFLQSPAYEPESYQAIIAENLASTITKSPDVSQTIGDAARTIQIINLYKQIQPSIDNYLGTHLPSINIDENSIKSSEKFTPLIGPYNNLRQCAFALNPNDNSSVDRFYLSLGDFTIDTALISTGGLDLVSKEGTGVVINVMQDTKVEEKIVSMCKSDCTKKFEDNTQYFVSMISGQLLPTANNEMSNVVNYFKNFINSFTNFSNKK